MIIGALRCAGGAALERDGELDRAGDGRPGAEDEQRGAGVAREGGDGERGGRREADHASNT